jgi:hypothetical protein
MADELLGDIAAGERCNYIMRAGAVCGNRCSTCKGRCNLHKKSGPGFKACPGIVPGGCGKWVLATTDRCATCLKGLRLNRELDLESSRQQIRELQEEVEKLRIGYTSVVNEALESKKDVATALATVATLEAANDALAVSIRSVRGSKK